MRVLEGHDEIGGGTRSAALTLPGFCHDVCSGCHPIGILSPFFRRLPSRRARSALDPAPRLRGAPARWRAGRVPAPLARRHRARLGRGCRCLPRTLRPLPARTARTARAISSAPCASRGIRCAWRASGCSGSCPRPRCSALASAACGRARCSPAARRTRSCRSSVRSPRRSAMIFALTGHVEDWPVAAGGSQAIARALASYLERLGGRIETGVPVRSLADIPPARVVLFDTSPAQLADVCAPLLPARLPSPIAPLSLRPRRLQARLGARRADPVARPALPRGLDRPRRRHARGDRRGRGRRLARRASRSGPS